jgi:teichoic acid transport system permease protein
MNTLLGLWKSRSVVWTLAKKDFTKRYVGSYFGIVWMFIQPIMTILIFYFVFQVGFRSVPAGNAPYVLWLTAGIVPWFFFSDAWGYATQSYYEYNYLVKKVVFRTSIIPVIKIVSSLIVHSIFILIMFVLYICYGYAPTIYWIQCIYYSFCVFVLLWGLSYLTASIAVFFKDMTQTVGIFLQFGMWLVPIMWELGMFPAKYNWIFKLNPLYYVVYGYRDCMINGVWFFDHKLLTLYFWATTLVIFVLGSVVFKRLKPHFADVL